MTRAAGDAARRWTGCHTGAGARHGKASVHKSARAVKRARQWISPKVGWDAVHAVQRSRCRPLDLWFSHFPLLGNELQYVMLLPLFAWYVDTAFTRQFCFAAFAVCWLNNAVKDLLCLPRPPPQLHVGGTAHSDHAAQQYGFPSTHSAHAVALGAVAASAAVATGAMEPAVAATLAAVNAAHVMLSRVYLGLHSAADIAGGIAIGLLMSVALLPPIGLGDAVDSMVCTGPHGQLGGLITTAAMLLAYPDKDCSNTAFTETAIFAALWNGACLASLLPGVSGRGASPFAPAAFVAGVLLLAATRELISRALKALLRAVGRHEVPSWRCAREYATTAAAALCVAALPPVLLPLPPWLL